MIRNTWMLLLIVTYLTTTTMAQAENEQAPFTATITGVNIVKNPPAQLTVDSGGTAALTTETSTCGGSITKQWLFEGAPLVGETGDTLTLANVDPAMAGIYQFQITIDGVDGFSTECELKVYSTVRIVNHPWPQTVYVGDNVELVVSYTGGTGPWTVVWYKDNVDLGAPNSTTLNLSNVQLADTGEYQAVITDNLGNSAESLSATLTVLPAITPPPEFYLDYASGSTYALSFNANEAGFSSIFSAPDLLPAGCTWSDINALVVFHRLYESPWTVIEEHSIANVISNGESDVVTFSGSGIDWGSAPTSFVISGSIFDTQYAFKTDLTGDDWLWINVDYVATLVNSVQTTLNNGMYIIDLR